MLNESVNLLIFNYCILIYYLKINIIVLSEIVYLNISSMTQPKKDNAIGNSGSYQDYVIKKGQFIGKFEEMYQHFDDPWHQAKNEIFASEKAVAINLLKKLRSLFKGNKVLDIGCGLGHFSEAIFREGFDLTAVDISPTAIKKAQASFPYIDFRVARADDYALFNKIKPDYIVMAETTWYILDRLDDFIHFLKTDMKDTFLLHLLTTYPEGRQQYGKEKFTNLQEIRQYFGMHTLESGQVYLPGSQRTWFLGTWNEGCKKMWHLDG